MVSIRRLTPHNISPFKSTKPEPTLKKSKKFPITPKTQTPTEICCSFNQNEGFTVDDNIPLLYYLELVFSLQCFSFMLHLLLHLFIHFKGPHC